MARKKQDKTLEAIITSVAVLVVAVPWMLHSTSSTNPLAPMLSNMLSVVMKTLFFAVVIGGVLLLVVLRMQSTSRKPPARPYIHEQSSTHAPSSASFGMATASPRPATRQYSHRPNPSTPSHTVEPRKTSPHLSVDMLRRMDWLAFEHLVLAIIEHEGFVARKTSAGPDGGVDIEMYRSGRGAQERPYALVQCKARLNKLVGVDKARELYGVMASRDVSRGYLVSNSGFSPEAHAFARNSPGLGLCDLDWLVSTLKEIPAESLARWTAKFMGDDFDVPSCPACEVKMVRRDGTRNEFWGCRNFPRCKQTITMRASSRTH